MLILSSDTFLAKFCTLSISLDTAMIGFIKLVKSLGIKILNALLKTLLRKIILNRIKNIDTLQILC